MKKLLQTILLLLVMVIAASAQISKGLCDEVFGVAEKVIKPTHVYHRIVFTNDCSYQYVGAKNIGFYLSVEQFRTEEEATMGFAELMEGYTYPAKPRRFSDSFWTEKVSFNNRPPDSSDLLLRKGPYVIDIMSRSRQLLSLFEKEIRSVSPFHR
jgi:hypothetical protein